MTVSNQSWRGTSSDPGKTVETRDCNPGEFMVGFRGKSGDWMDSLEVLCRRF